MAWFKKKENPELSKITLSKKTLAQVVEEGDTKKEDWELVQEELRGATKLEAEDSTERANQSLKERVLEVGATDVFEVKHTVSANKQLVAYGKAYRYSAPRD